MLVALLTCVALRAAGDSGNELHFEAEADLVASPKSSGGGSNVDGVFGGRLSYLSPYYVGGSVALKGGTLGASAAQGTQAVYLRAIDVRVDLLAHLRQRYDIGGGIGLTPCLMLGLDMSFQQTTTTVQNNRTSVFAFIPGFGYGFSVGVEWRTLVVTAQALLVSQDARTPAIFAGLLLGYVLRL